MPLELGLLADGAFPRPDGRHLLGRGRVHERMGVRQKPSEALRNQVLFVTMPSSVFAEGTSSLKCIKMLHLSVLSVSAMKDTAIFAELKWWAALRTLFTFSN